MCFMESHLEGKKKKRQKKRKTPKDNFRSKILSYQEVKLLFVRRNFPS